MLEFVKAHWRPLALGAALTVVFLAGRFERPAPVQTKTTTAQTVKDTTHIYTQADLDKAVASAVDTERQRHTTEIIREVRQKDGTEVKTTQITTDASTLTHAETVTHVQAQEQQSVAQVVQAQTTTTTITKPSDAPRKWSVSLGAGVPLQLTAPFLGAPYARLDVNRYLFGPVWVGGYLSTNLDRFRLGAGLEAGVSFP